MYFFYFGKHRVLATHYTRNGNRVAFNLDVATAIQDGMGFVRYALPITVIIHFLAKVLRIAFCVNAVCYRAVVTRGSMDGIKSLVDNAAY